MPLRTISRMLLRLPVPWVFVLGYLLGAWLQSLRPIPVPFHPTHAVTQAVGLTTFALGGAIAGWGWFTFFRARTTTVPGQASSTFVTWGPYRFSRNPMYVGLTIAYIGEAFILRQLWPVFVLPLVVAYVNGTVIPVEESKLTEVFGDDYRRYRTRVRRWL